MRNVSLFTCSLLTLSIVMLVGCGKDAPTAPPATAPAVVVQTIQPQSVDISTELPGRTQAYRIAEVRARVDGIVLKREFTEGGLVKAGQVLYRIDPAPYRAQVNSALANLQKAEADVLAKKAQAERYQALVSAEAISRQAGDDAQAAYKQAQAAVAAAKAALENSQINLDYTVVRSPIDGRIGKSNVTEGAYVRAQEATSMAVVHQLDPIYVDVAQSTSELLKLKNDVAAGLVERSADGSAPVTLKLENGELYSELGQLQFADSTVDPTTGSVIVRALFPNKEGLLMPGMFVRAALKQGVNSQALLLPQQAVTFNIKGKPQAMFVNAENVVEVRELNVSRTIGTQHWLVSEGVQPGDRIIIEGLQKVRPGVTVAPTEQADTAQQPKG